MKRETYQVVVHLGGALGDQALEDCAGQWAQVECPGEGPQGEVAVKGVAGAAALMEVGRDWWLG